jgi:hypothetical protein
MYLKKQFSGLLIGTALMSFLHLKFGLNPPLFIQVRLAPVKGRRVRRCTYVSVIDLYKAVESSRYAIGEDIHPR